jgi:hypothetical protein
LQAIIDATNTAEKNGLLTAGQAQALRVNENISQVSVMKARSSFNDEDLKKTFIQLNIAEKQSEALLNKINSMLKQ